MSSSSLEWSSVPGWLQVVIIVAAVVQIAVEVAALVVLFRTPDERIAGGKRWLWVVLILFVNLVGAIVFFAVGRKPAIAADPLVAGEAAATGAGEERGARAVEVLYGPKEDDRS